MVDTSGIRTDWQNVSEADWQVNNAKAQANRITAEPLNALGQAVIDLSGQVGGTVTDASVAGAIGPETQAALAPVIDARTGNGQRPVGRGELMLNVKDFGAVGDGTTDDTAAIQAAIDSLPLNTADPEGVLNPKGFANGGQVFIPKGRYVVSGAITLRRGLRLFGESRESSQIVSESTGSVLYYADQGSYIPDEITVENLSIWQDSTVTPTSGAGINIDFTPAGGSGNHSLRPTIRNVFVEGTYVGFSIAGGMGAVLEQCDALKCVTDGFVIRYQVEHTPGLALATTYTSLIGCYSYINGGNGYRFVGVAYTNMVACAADSNVGYGYHITGGWYNTITGGAEQNKSGAMYLDGCEGTVVSLLVIQSGAVTPGAISAITSWNSKNTTILGGYYWGHSGVTGSAFYEPAGGVSSMTVIGPKFVDQYNASRTNFTSRYLHLTDDTGLAGRDGRWGLGLPGGGTDPSALFRVGGSLSASSDAVVKVDATHTADTWFNTGLTVLQRTAPNLAIGGNLMGFRIAPPVKGAGSTVQGTVGFFIQETSAGTYNTDLLIDNGTWGGAPPGQFAIYSTSTRPSVFWGPIEFGALDGQSIRAGTGSPEGVVAAPVGSLYTRKDGGAGTTLYVKESGTGATGWVAK